MTLMDIPFLAIGITSLIFILLTLRLCHQTAQHSRIHSWWFNLSFIILLITAGGSQANIKPIKNAIPIETTSAIPVLFNIDFSKEGFRLWLNYLTLGRVDAGVAMRNADLAPKLFSQRHLLSMFIIGESLRNDAFIKPERGPYSPALLARVKKGLGVIFPDVCAYSNATFLSVPRLVTAANTDDEYKAQQGVTILALAKAAGANTLYISNHPDLVVKEKGHETISTSTMNVPADDAVTVTVLQDFITRHQNQPTAALIHLFGQHFPYQERYPENLFPTTPSTIKKEEQEELEYQYAAEYGNKVLLDFATLLDKQEMPAFLVFTPDHGENLVSDGTGKKFHAGSTPGQHDTRVPAVILWNKPFQESGWLADIQPLLNAKTLLAHQDIANAWLTLNGMPHVLSITSKPMTWGNTGATSCQTLPP